MAIRLLTLSSTAIDHQVESRIHLDAVTTAGKLGTGTGMIQRARREIAPVTIAERLVTLQVCAGPESAQTITRVDLRTIMKKPLLGKLLNIRPANLLQRGAKPPQLASSKQQRGLVPFHLNIFFAMSVVPTSSFSWTAAQSPPFLIRQLFIYCDLQQTCTTLNQS